MLSFNGNCVGTPDATRNPEEPIPPQQSSAQKKMRQRKYFQAQMQKVTDAVSSIQNSSLNSSFKLQIFDNFDH